jgi:hypothetical protein
LDFTTAELEGDFNARIIRNAGAHGDFEIRNNGTGNMEFYTDTTTKALSIDSNQIVTIKPDDATGNGALFTLGMGRTASSAKASMMFIAEAGLVGAANNALIERDAGIDGQFLFKQEGEGDFHIHNNGSTAILIDYSQNITCGSSESSSLKAKGDLLIGESATTTTPAISIGQARTGDGGALLRMYPNQTGGPGTSIYKGPTASCGIGTLPTDLVAMGFTDATIIANSGATVADSLIIHSYEEGGTGTNTTVITGYHHPTTSARQLATFIPDDGTGESYVAIGSASDEAMLLVASTDNDSSVVTGTAKITRCNTILASGTFVWNGVVGTGTYELQTGSYFGFDSANPVIRHWNGTSTDPYTFEVPLQQKVGTDVQVIATFNGDPEWCVSPIMFTVHAQVQDGTLGGGPGGAYNYVPTYNNRYSLWVNPRAIAVMTPYSPEWNVNVAGRFSFSIQVVGLQESHI